MLNARGLLGVVLASAFLAIALWYALGTFTVSREVSGRSSGVVADGSAAPAETRSLTLECRSDGGATYVGAAGEPMFFDGVSWSPDSPNPICEEVRRSRYPLAIGLAVLGTVIGVVVAASGSRTAPTD